MAAPPFWWVQPLVTAVVTAAAAGAAGLYARFTIKANRHIARVRATLDLIERTESQPYYQQLWEAFRTAREATGGFDSLLDSKNTMIKKQRADVLNFLNHYELIAVGCKNGVLDEIFYKNYMRGAVVRDWEKAEDFIRRLRTPRDEEPRPAAYKEFEILACKWQAEIHIERAAYNPQ